MLGLGDVAAALEHHVLEEVGEPGPARLLVLASHVVPDVDGDDRHEVVLADDQAEPVEEPLVREGDVGKGHACLAVGMSDWWPEGRDAALYGPPSKGGVNPALDTAARSMLAFHLTRGRCTR